MNKAEALDKVQKLIAMSASSFVEEARTAALHAAKLIREHNLLIVASQSSAKTPPFPWKSWDEVLDSVNRQQDDIDNLHSKLTELQRKHDRLQNDHAKAGGQTHAGNGFHNRKSTPRDNQPKLITSRYVATCKQCGGMIDIDEKALWRPLYGVTHPQCRSYWENL